MFDKFLERKAGVFYFVFRVVVGLMFMMHGLQNLFGVFDVKYLATAWSLPWIGGIVMLVGGLMITLGIYVRFVASLGAVVMFVAYFWYHATWSDWWSPLTNHGESALHYLVSMLVLMAFGSGRFLFKDSKKKEVNVKKVGRRTGRKFRQE